MKQSKKARAKCLISDELWEGIKPLLPKHNPYQRHIGGSPLKISDRAAMNGIFFVLKTGCPWKALDVTHICPGTIAHRRFQQWLEAGVFKAFWKKELQKYDAIKGIDWKWQSVDASFVKAPIGGSKKTGKNPTDRGKIGTKRSILTDAKGIPISIIVAEANIADHFFLKITLDSIVIKRPNPKQVYQNLLADKDYGDWRSRNVARVYGYDAHIPQKKNARTKIRKRPGRRKARRWVVEQTFGCLNRGRSIFIRWSKDPENYEALLNIAAAVLIFNRSHKK